MTTGFAQHFVSSNEHKLDQTVPVAYKSSGQISLSREALSILILGMAAAANVHKLTAPVVDKHLLLKLAVLLVAPLESTIPSETFLRGDVHLMKGYVEDYLSSMEETGPKTLDNSTPEDFNNYINAKLLLIDIREWLAVECDI